MTLWIIKIGRHLGRFRVFLGSPSKTEQARRGKKKNWPLGLALETKNQNIENGKGKG